MIEPATGSNEAAARVADALQAAYFRGVLSEHRAHIDVVLTKVRARIEIHREAGDRFEAHKLQRQLREQEDEGVRLDWLISRLDKRYSEAWADLDIEQG